MHWCLMWLLACGSPAPAPAPNNDAVPAAEAGQRGDVDLDAFAGLLEKGGITVIDVRTPQEFASGHVPGAANVPLGFGVDDPAIAALDRDQPVYVICQSGRRSARAADQLAGAGFRAINVQGGTGAWIASGRDVAQ